MLCSLEKTPAFDGRNTSRRPANSSFVPTRFLHFKGHVQQIPEWLGLMKQETLRLAHVPCGRIGARASASDAAAVRVSTPSFS